MICIMSCMTFRHLACFLLKMWRTSSYEFVLNRHIQEQFSGNPIWYFAKHNSGMMYACFSVAQLFAYSSTFDSYGTR